uniref:Uncharacterized protein n=1 Tax=Arundo donax TaxID=35708 RepID=A0A0A9G0M7_ARUDO
MPCRRQLMENNQNNLDISCCLGLLVHTTSTSSMIQPVLAGSPK